MTTLTNLKKLAEAVYSPTADDWELKRALFEFNKAANPAAVLKMIELIELQHEVLVNEKYVSRYSHVVEAIAAYEEFNK